MSETNDRKITWLEAHLWEVATTVAALIFSITSAVLSNYAPFNGYITVLVAMAAAAMTAIFSQTLRSMLSVAAMEKILAIQDERLKSSLEKMESRFGSLGVMDRIYNSESHALIKQVATEILREQAEEFKTTHQGFSISASNSALSSNAAFWHHLPRFAPNAQCYVLHSSDVAIWKSKEGRGSLSAQKKFIEAGGVIQRIFVGPHMFDAIERSIAESLKRCPDPWKLITDHGYNDGNGSLSPIDHYGDVIRLMHYYNIHVYYQIGENSQKKDFTITHLGNDQYIQLGWKYSEDRKSVESCDFYSSSNRRRMVDWDDLREGALEFEYLERMATYSI